MSFSMASTCLLRCFRYMPHARQYDSSSRPNRWLTVLLCISDLQPHKILLQFNFIWNFKNIIMIFKSVYVKPWQKAEQKEEITYFKCQKKKCPILWFVRAFFSRNRTSGLSRYCSYFRTLNKWKVKHWYKKKSTGKHERACIINNNWIYQSYLNQLNEVLWEFVISQILLKASNCEVSDHWIRIVTVKQLHGLFRLYCGPVFKKAIHLCNFISGIPLHR